MKTSIYDDVSGLPTGCMQTWPNRTEGWFPNVYPQAFPNGTITVSTTPTQCFDNYHVFACEHADRCKCGKANRTPEPKKCGVCGK